MSEALDEKLKALRREYLKYVDQELPKVPAQRGPIERWDQWLAAIAIRSREEHAKLREAMRKSLETINTLQGIGMAPPTERKDIENCDTYLFSVDKLKKTLETLLSGKE